ncbi:MAG: amidohydrolase family protein [Candidatus Latescibacteria bacterium]|nr:amidohydrolase family protein [Candidatus Latescibacterota bacterium]
MLDWIIRNAEIADGSGGEPFVGDIGVEGDTIVQVGQVGGSGRREVDAGGRVAAPGFIDIHTHSDYSLLIDGRGESALYQGVTTQVNGNCGISAFPVGREGPYLGPFDSARLRGQLAIDWQEATGYFAALERAGLGINTAFLVGHGALRLAVMGYGEWSTSAQQRTMRSLLARELEAGAWGLSTGLTYIPGCYADTEELVDLAQVMVPYGGFYATHMRNYTSTIMEALEEALEIGRRAGVPTHISHMTPCPPSTGRSPELLDRLARAQADGQDATAETELYATGSTSLKSLLPPWALAGGDEALVKRLQDPALRQRMWEEIVEHGSELGGSSKTGLMQMGAWDKLWLGNCQVNQALTGCTFAELARRRGQDPFAEVCDILIEEGGAASFYGEDKTDWDIEQLGQSPYCGYGSDGLALALDGPLAEEREHPRCYGGMAYILRTLVRERGVVPLAQLVHKITAFPARRLGLTDRGLLQAGQRADIVVFDLDTVSDQATMVEPRAYSQGMEWIWTNGICALEAGRTTGLRGGRVLKRGDYD